MRGPGRFCGRWPPPARSVTVTRACLIASMESSPAPSRRFCSAVAPKMRPCSQAIVLCTRDLGSVLHVAPDLTRRVTRAFAQRGWTFRSVKMVFVFQVFLFFSFCVRLRVPCGGAGRLRSNNFARRTRQERGGARDAARATAWLQPARARAPAQRSRRCSSALARAASATGCSAPQEALGRNAKGQKTFPEPATSCSTAGLRACAVLVLLAAAW